jgi:hypothetical protein
MKILPGTIFKNKLLDFIWELSSKVLLYQHKWLQQKQVNLMHYYGIELHVQNTKQFGGLLLPMVLCIVHIVYEQISRRHITVRGKCGVCIGTPSSQPGQIIFGCFVLLPSTRTDVCLAASSNRVGVAYKYSPSA